MTNTQLQADLVEGHNRVSILRDYKANSFPHDFCRQQTFTGEVYPYEVPDQKPVQGGIITELPGYIIKDGNFFPGIYQNLISPLFTVEFDNDGFVKKNVEVFKKIMDGQVEKTKKSGQSADLLRSHIRHEIFSPSLFRRQPTS